MFFEPSIVVVLKESKFICMSYIISNPWPSWIETCKCFNEFINVCTSCHKWFIFVYKTKDVRHLKGGLILPPCWFASPTLPPPLISSPPFNSHHLRLRLSDSPPFLVPPRHEPPSRGHLRRCRCLEGCVQTACCRSSL
jgi:hypothetical protein